MQSRWALQRYWRWPQQSCQPISDSCCLSGGSSGNIGGSSCVRGSNPKRSHQLVRGGGKRTQTIFPEAPAVSGWGWRWLRRLRPPHCGSRSLMRLQLSSAEPPLVWLRCSAAPLLLCRAADTNGQRLFHNGYFDVRSSTNRSSSTVVAHTIAETPAEAETSGRNYNFPSR